MFKKRKKICSALILFVAISMFLTSKANAMKEKEIKIHYWFKGEIVDLQAGKPGSISTADIDQDGLTDIVLSVYSDINPYGTGYLTIYYTQKNGGFVKKVIQSSQGIVFPNEVTIVDVNGNGKPDMILAGFFLAPTPIKSGTLTWFEQTDKDWLRHDITSNQPFFYHRALWHDLDGDRRNDILTVGECQKSMGDYSSEVHLYKGWGSVQFAYEPAIIASNSLGSLPRLADIDMDGDLDLIGTEFLIGDSSAAWLENKGNGKWEKHIIQKNLGPSIQIEIIENFCGDGRRVAILANHVNSTDYPDGPKEGVFLLAMPQNLEDIKLEWPAKMISNGIKAQASPVMNPQNAPGIFAKGDIDNDGDLDLVVTGDGDQRVFFLEQVAPYQFQTHTLVEQFPDCVVAVDDLDKDGKMEVILANNQQSILLILRFNRP